MNDRLGWSKRLSALGLCGALAACGGGDSRAPVGDHFTVSGSTSGLLGGEHVALGDNLGNAWTLSANGPFDLKGSGPAGQEYLLTVERAPDGAACAVARGHVFGAREEIAGVQVTCSHSAFPLGGYVRGLDSGGQLTLLNSATGERLSLSESGNFVFSRLSPKGASYSVSVVGQPLGRVCAPAAGTGSGMGIVGPVLGVRVVCAKRSHPIRGRLQGLEPGERVTLLNNGRDALTLMRDGVFMFKEHVAHGGSFGVTVSTQPRDQTCTAAAGTGSMSGVVGPVDGPRITCSNKVHHVGGTLRGLAEGEQVTLINNGGDPRTLTANGPFTFTEPVAHGASYSVTVSTSPLGQVCSVAAGTGSGSGVVRPVRHVRVRCAAQAYPVGGTLNGLAPGEQVTLLNNGADAHTLSADGPFAFEQPIAHGGSYAVTVSSQPRGQVYSVSAGTGSGAGVVSPVKTVRIQCSDKTHRIAGSLSGLAAGGQVTLLNNGADPLTLTSNGHFELAVPVAHGGSNSVTVSGQPAGQLCSVVAGSGVGSGIVAPVDTVRISCSNKSYPVQGVLSGLSAGAQVTLLNNGADAITLTTNGTFEFPTWVTHGGSYSVTVSTPPPHQSCSVAAGTGSGAGIASAVDRVRIVCSVRRYGVAGVLSGLAPGQQVTLLNNNADALTLNADGVFSFSEAIPHGGSYSVTVSAQPSTQTCTVAAGAGGGSVTADVRSVLVTCSSRAYPVGGTLNGLAEGGQVTLVNNAADALTLSSNGPFTFAQPVAHGGAYSVAVSTHPVAQRCEVVGASGTGVRQPVAGIHVSCAPAVTANEQARDLAIERMRALDLAAPWMFSSNWTNGAYDAWARYLAGKISAEEYAAQVSAHPANGYYPDDPYGWQLPSQVPPESPQYAGVVRRNGLDCYFQPQGFNVLSPRFMHTQDPGYLHAWLNVTRDMMVNERAAILNTFSPSQLVNSPAAGCICPESGRADALSNVGIHLSNQMYALATLAKGIGMPRGSSWATASVAPQESAVTDAERSLFPADVLADIANGMAKNYAPTLLKYYTEGTPETRGAPAQRFIGLYSLAMLGHFFPTTQEVSRLISQIDDSMGRFVDNNFYPDGGQVEQSFNYSNGTADGMLRLANMQGSPWANRTMRKYVDYWLQQAAISTPQGGQPQVGNVYWGSGRLRDGISFAQTSMAFPYTGFYAQRTDWGIDSPYLFFFARRSPSGHTMAGSNSIQVGAYGRPLLVGGGSPNYSGSSAAYPYSVPYLDESSSWKLSTVVVDGRSQSGGAVLPTNSPIPARWAIGDAMDSLEGIYDSGYGRDPYGSNSGATSFVQHRRLVTFLRELKAWVVVDFLTPRDAGAHTYTQIWKFAAPLPQFEGAGPQMEGFHAHQIELPTSLESRRIYTRDATAGAVNLSIYQAGPSQMTYATHFGSKEGRFGYSTPTPLLAPDVHVSWDSPGAQTVVSILLPYRDVANDGMEYFREHSSVGERGVDMRINGVNVSVRASAVPSVLQAAGTTATGAHLLIVADRANGVPAVLHVAADGANSYLQEGDTARPVQIPTGFSWSRDSAGTWRAHYQ